MDQGLARIQTIESKEDQIMTKPLNEKRFISGKQAQAAADKAGLAEGSYQIGKPEGEKMFAVIEMLHPALAAVKPVEGTRQDLELRITDLQAFIRDIKDEAGIAAAYETLNGMAAELTEAVVASLDEEIAIRATQIEADQQLNQAQVAGVADQKNGKLWIRASTILKPTKMVWVIADDMVAEARLNDRPAPTRKEVQDECVKRGIASGTARTQYQHWFKQQNESAAAPRAQIVDGKIVPPTK
jgi:hypothetical protein